MSCVMQCKEITYWVLGFRDKAHLENEGRRHYRGPCQYWLTDSCHLSHLHDLTMWDQLTSAHWWPGKVLMWWAGCSLDMHTLSHMYTHCVDVLQAQRGPGQTVGHSLPSCSSAVPGGPCVTSTPQPSTTPLSPSKPPPGCVMNQEGCVPLLPITKLMRSHTHAQGTHHPPPAAYPTPTTKPAHCTQPPDNLVCQACQLVRWLRLHKHSIVGLQRGQLHFGPFIGRLLLCFPWGPPLFCTVSRTGH